MKVELPMDVLINIIVKSFVKGTKAEIKITKITNWIRENKWVLLMLIAALLAGIALFFITYRPISPQHAAQFPQAAISADISAARIEDLIQDINL